MPDVFDQVAQEQQAPTQTQVSAPQTAQSDVFDSLAANGNDAGALMKSQSAEQPGWLDREIPLTSYGAATESGVQSIARGVRGAIKGTLSLLDPRPQSDEESAAVAGAGGNPAALPVFRILRSVGHSVQD